MHRFFDEDFVIAFLGKVPEIGLTPSKITGCEIVPLKRKHSGKRGVLLFRLSVKGEGSPPITRVSIVGRFRRPGRDKETLQIMRQLWQKGFGGQSRLRIPQPIAYIEEPGLLLAYRARGMTLDKMLEAGHKSLPSSITLAAQWLAQLHQTTTSSPRSLSSQEDRKVGEKAVMRKLEKALKKFKRKHPSLSQRAAVCANEIHQRVTSVGTKSFTLTHGDYLLKNVLSDGSDVTVVDLDRTGLFDPAMDVGKFLRHMTVKTWEYGSDFDPEAMRELFLKGYAQEYSTEFSKRIAAWEALRYVGHSSREDNTESAVFWLQKAEERLRA